jgi:hypothetical protein
LRSYDYATVKYATLDEAVRYTYGMTTAGTGRTDSDGEAADAKDG